MTLSLLLFVCQAQATVAVPTLGATARVAVGEDGQGLATEAEVPGWAKGRPVHFDPAPPSSDTHRTVEPALPEAQEDGFALTSSRLGAAAASVQPDAAPATNPIRYNGGAVQHQTHVFLIFWGSDWNTSQSAGRTKLQEFFRWLSGSSYADILTQYFDHNGAIGSEVALTSYTDSRTPPASMTHAQLRQEVDYSISNQGWPAPSFDDDYILLPQENSTYSSEVFKGCAFHEYDEELGASLILDGTPVGQMNACQEGMTVVHAMESSASHEWAEAATDPQPWGHVLNVSGWENSSGNEEEVADLCEDDPAVEMGGFVVERLFDDYLNAAHGGEYACVAQDAEVVRQGERFTVQAGSSSATAVTHEASLSGSVKPVGYPAYYKFTVTGPNGYDASSPASFGGIGATFGTVPVTGSVPGLKGSSQYTVKLEASSELTESPINGQVSYFPSESTFTTPDWRPVSTTEGATEVKAHTATLHGNVNPQGSDTHYQFEYGTTTGYGASVPVPAGDVGAGTASVPVSAAISGLEVGTTYHFRVVATSAEGTAYGADAQFETPNKPVVTAEAPSYVNTLEPTMNATINPERADTDYQFEYGTTEAYGTKVPVPAVDIGSTAAVMVERGLKGLKRSTVYHYRVTAENEVGVVHGADRSFTTLPPCKGAEQKCVWSLQEPSNPLPPSKFEMKSASCASATLCIAVGRNLYNNRSFVDRWNGSAWSLLSGAVPGEMKHVTCLTSGCFAVGVEGGAAYSWFIGEYPVGGGGWIAVPITTPLPTGATETVLDGVSCSGESACTAVGSYKGSEGIYHPLVERWNGTAWSLQSAPNPAEGTAQKAMLSVSCISIGCITVGEAAGKPVAETWVSGSWALSSPKLPAGAKGGKLSSVSCSNVSCVAVGNSNEGVGTEKALAEKMEFLSWSLMSAPSPAEAKGFVELTGVSCGTESTCTAVGYYATGISGSIPTEVKTLAEAWNGSSWAIQSSPNLPGQVYNFLTDVSCSGVGACTSVGYGTPGPVQEPTPLAERWNGSSWSTQTLVDPEEPLEDEMRAVSCSTNTLCVGVGKNLFAENSFAEVWNGKEWMIVSSVAGEVRKVSCIEEGCFMVGASGGSAETWIVFKLNGAWGVEKIEPPLPGGSSESLLEGVSCSGESACTAVGSYKGSEGTYHPLVERWNGTAWSLQSAPGPAEGTAQNAMQGVSCAGASSCMAVGEAAGRPVAETWNGSAWSRSAAPPMPSGAKGATFAAVSCGSVKVCMAVGDSYEGTGTEKALAERWSGGTWSIITTPGPAGAKGFVDLTDVACLSPNACFSAGYYAPEVSGGAPLSLKTLVGSWEGTEWTVLTTPNLASQTFDALAGISCSTSIDCTAVGGATSSYSKRPPVQLAMRFE
jgi:hypothetical protein